MISILLPSPKNKFRVVGSVVWISLTQGKETQIDTNNWSRVSPYKWSAARRDNKWYAQARVNGKLVLLHRVLFPTGEGVDHRNGDGLDNRAENFRAAAQFQNSANRGKNKNNTSGFKGVFWFKRTGQWKAAIQHHRKQVHLGYFKSSVAAAVAYDKATFKLNGSFAKGNFL